MMSRRIGLALVLAAMLPGYAAADVYVKHNTPVVVTMQNTCVDFLTQRIAGGDTLTSQGFKQKRKTRKKTIYEAKQRLPGATFNTVYQLELASGRNDLRSCRVSLIRTSYDTSRRVYNAALAALQKRGGRLGAASQRGSSGLTQVQVGETRFFLNSKHVSNSLIMDYYIPRK